VSASSQSLKLEKEKEILSPTGKREICACARCQGCEASAARTAQSAALDSKGAMAQKNQIPVGESINKFSRA